MILNRYYIECLSQASYLLGDEASGEAILIDPRRDINDFLTDANESGLRIVGVINTHFHADFVAGHLEIAKSTGAWIGYGSGAEADYPIRTFRHGERLPLGSLELEILATPGHTWESISILVRESPEAKPNAVFTGDTLFIGDVGRPDLAAAVGADPRELAHAMYASIHNVLLKLPDSVRVLPAHGAGSACGKNLSTALESTLGKQRVTNPSIQAMPEEEFVEMLLNGQPAVPQYFAQDAVMNRSNHQLLDDSALPQVPVQADPQAQVLIDTREPKDFAQGHLAAAINIDLDGRFAESVGMFVGLDDSVLVVAEAQRAAEAKMRLGRVGIDHVIGYIDSDNLHDPAVTLHQLAYISASEARDIFATGETLFLDVRNVGELDTGSIPGSLNIPLAELINRYDELLKAQPIIVYCASGWRASVAASFLMSKGFTSVRNLDGGFKAWDQQLTPA